MRIAIGIDPGVNIGVAVWNCGSHVPISAATIKDRSKLITAIKLYLADGATVHVRCEDPRMNRPIFFRNVSPRAQLKIARNVGMNQQITTDIESELRTIAESHPDRFTYLMCRPGSAKWKAEDMRLLAKWDKRCSQHARDAMKLVCGL